MKCSNCGHGRQWHKRASGKLKLPCQQFIRAQDSPLYGPNTIGPIVKCKCRDWKP